MLKSDIRGAEYRVNAQRALDAAEGTGLDQVKRRHEAAAEVWNDLADFEDRRSESARTLATRQELLEDAAALAAG